MALFGKRNANAPAKNTLEYFEAQSKSARGTWIIVLVLTLINALLLIFSDSGTVFLFSSWFPMDQTVAGLVFMALEAPEYVTPLVLGICSFVLMVLPAIFWKKSVIWPILATLTYLVDTVYLFLSSNSEDIGYLSMEGLSVSMLVFHVLVLIMTAVGAFNAMKAAKARKAQAPQETIPQFMNETNNKGPEL